MSANAAHLDRKVDVMIRSCREASLKITPQRVAVYRALLACEDHPGPEALCQRVRWTMPTISLATVYRVLRELKDLGVVQDVNALGATQRYDARTDHHHHLVCTRCGAVIDYEDETFDKLTPSKPLGGFEVRQLSVQLNGWCVRCARKGPERTRKRSK